MIGRWFLNKRVPHLLYNNRAFRLVVRSSYVFVSSNCYLLKYISWFIWANDSCCLQKQMNIELQIERLYCTRINRINLKTRLFSRKYSICTENWTDSVCSSEIPVPLWQKLIRVKHFPNFRTETDLVNLVTEILTNWHLFNVMLARNHGCMKLMAS